jgi:Ser/Thr protein kinase RdoA (MazF antagonist)
MEHRIKSRFNDDILHEAMRRYGIAPDRIHLLDGFESFMYEFERDGAEYILRIGHSLRRSIPMIQGEVNWINYLSDGGVPAARAILSENNRLVELVDDGQGEHFLATAFVRARGGHPKRADWTPRFYEVYGAMMGRMHALSKRYEPDPSTWRPQWDDPIMLEVEQFLPPSEAITVDKYRALIAHLRALSKDADSYGLIHQDAHTGNLFVDETGNITLFDFDDCVYGWFIYDIAMALFYAVPFDPSGASRFTSKFMPSFLQGYRRENRLDPVWLKQLPCFLKMREIDLYAIVYRSFDVNNLDDPWVASYMEGRKQRIENDVPFIDFDFESLASHLAPG